MFRWLGFFSLILCLIDRSLWFKVMVGYHWFVYILVHFLLKRKPLLSEIVIRLSQTTLILWTSLVLGIFQLRIRQTFRLQECFFPLHELLNFCHELTLIEFLIFLSLSTSSHRGVIWSRLGKLLIGRVTLLWLVEFLCLFISWRSELCGSLSCFGLLPFV